MTQTRHGSHPPLAKTPLHALHLALGAKMAPFAGYEMPIQYPSGIIAEHLHTRHAAGLFDVSHMGQAFLAGTDHPTVAQALESLVPADLVSLPRGRQRYSQLVNDDGGILDDLMVTRSPSPADDGALGLIVNAAPKEADFAVLRDRLAGRAQLIAAPDRALLALQGPQAAGVMANHCPDAAALAFMGARSSAFDGIDIAVSRSGYTGEDGFEISVKADQAAALWQALLADPRVRPIGLGARDTLRLEAGLCLYGRDLDPTTTPVEAGLAWSIGLRRRSEGGFPGAERVRLQLAHGPARRRVGLRLEGKAPAREGADIATREGVIIGKVTSGGYSPSLGAPIAMGYVEADHAAAGTRLNLIVRGKPLAGAVVQLPFVPHRYYRP